MTHPSQILLDAQAQSSRLPVCDHYCGTEDRMRKSMVLQQQLFEEFGTQVMDVTLDCEDGAPAGQEVQQAELVAELALSAPAGARVAARVHAVDHPSFQRDIATIVGQASERLCHLMLPKVESVADVHRAVTAIDAVENFGLPLHVLVESPKAVQNAFEIAAHPRVQSISFGLMDFVSAHAGAIPASAMTGEGQFTHPLVLRAKMEIASACHAYGKTPSHCVVTEFRDLEKLSAAANKAAHELGFTRMWSIHPQQIRPIIQAFAPSAELIHTAAELLQVAAKADWAPISFGGVLHDRASFRYYWQVLERAHATGQSLPNTVQHWFN